MTQLKSKISEKNPDVIALFETWIQDEPLHPNFYPSECLAIPNYNLYRYDNASTIRGGILLYVKPKLDGGPCRKIMRVAKGFEESAWHWLTINDQNKKNERVLLGCVYRKGASTSQNNELLNKLITEAAKLNDLVTLCGDFNYPKIQWNNITHSEDPTTEELFVNTLDEALLNQHVSSFTRKRGTDKPSCLDLVITDDQQTVSKPNIEEPFGNSDHSLVCWKSTFSCTETQDAPEPEPRPNFFKGNYQKMRSDLMCINWDEEFKSCQNINDLTTRFEEILHEKIKEHVPLKKNNTRKNGNHLPWVNYKTQKAIKRKYHAWKRFTESKSHAKYLQYIKERNRVTKKLRQAKKHFEKNIAKECKQNPKAFYSYANSHKRSSTNFIRLKKTEESYTLNDEDTASELNTYFASVFNKEEAEDQQNIYLPDRAIDNLLYDISISEDDVYDMLRKVNTNKSAGDDGIPPRILHECSKELMTPIHKIFEYSLNTGTVPDSWKSATITPIFKKGDRAQAENYRPISITSQVGKLLEKHIRKQIMIHLQNNNLLSAHQHGFCDRRSCMTNLLEALDDVTALIDEGIPVDEIFLDFKKAFDKVCHTRLLYKLHHMGIEGNILQWIASFLKGRIQRVKVNGSCSSWINVSSGVPQGSVLGPLLFVVFINDFPAMMKTNCKLFADDSKIYGKAQDEEDCNLIQDDLDTCSKWAETWKMSFHPDKCKAMHFGKDNKKFIYLLGNNMINATTEEKDLGVTISDDLCWSKHISNCVKKANRTLGMVKHTFSYMDKEMFLSLYKALIRPLLEYCPQIWNPFLKRDINALESVQRRATKIVPELKDLPYEERLSKLGLYPLSERRLRGDMIATFKILNGFVDCNDTKLLPLNMGPIKTRSHRQQIKLNVAKNSIRQNFYTQRVILPWNELSNSTVNSESVNVFKGRYDKERLGMYNPT